MTEAYIISKPSLNLLCKSIDRFLHDENLRYEKVKGPISLVIPIITILREL